MTSWRPANTLVLKVGPLAAVPAPALLRSAVERRFGERLAAIAAQLGLPLVPPVQVSLDPGPGVTLLTDGFTASATERELEEAWRLEAPPERAPVPFGWDWQRWAAEVRALPDRDAVAAFLGEVGATLVRRRPQQLLTGRQAVSYVTRHGGPAASQADHTRLQTALGPVLALGIAVHDAQRVLDHLGDLPPDVERIEALVAGLRPHRVEVLVAADPAGGDGVPAGSEPVPAGADDRFAALAGTLLRELGVRLPDVRFVTDRELAAGRLAVRVNALAGQALPALPSGSVLVDADPSDLGDRFGPPRPLRNPATGARCAVVDQRHLPALQADGWQTWTALDYTALAVAAEVRRRAPALIDIHTVEYELALLHRTCPALVLETLSAMSLAELTDVLRGLLREGVSIRNLRLILERLLAFDVVACAPDRVLLGDRLALDAADDPDAAPTPQRVQYVRNGMRDFFAHRYGSGTNRIAALLVDDDVAGWVRALRPGVRGEERPGPDLGTLHTALRRQREAAGGARLLLTTAEVRGPLAELLAGRFPEVTVLAIEELPRDIEIVSLGRLSLDAA